MENKIDAALEDYIFTKNIDMAATARKLEKMIGKDDCVYENDNARRQQCAFKVDALLFTMAMTSELSVVNRCTASLKFLLDEMYDSEKEALETIEQQIDQQNSILAKKYMQGKVGTQNTILQLIVELKKGNNEIIAATKGEAVKTEITE